jgi:hypothetical protein
VLDVDTAEVRKIVGFELADRGVIWTGDQLGRELRTLGLTLAKGLLPGARAADCALLHGAVVVTGGDQALNSRRKRRQP